MDSLIQVYSRISELCVEVFNKASPDHIEKHEITVLCGANGDIDTDQINKMIFEHRSDDVFIELTKCFCQSHLGHNELPEHLMKVDSFLLEQPYAVIIVTYNTDNWKEGMKTVDQVKNDLRSAHYLIRESRMSSEVINTMTAP